MKVVLKNDEHTIYQRRDGRYAVEAADKKAINGDDKVAILVANDLIKAALPSEPEEQAVEEAAEDLDVEKVLKAAGKPRTRFPSERLVEILSRPADRTLPGPESLPGNLKYYI